MRALALALVVSLFAAGCLGGAEPATSEEVQAAAVTPQADANGTVPADGGINASAEDLGHAPHLHDYWLGRERVTLFEGDVDASAEAADATLFSAFFDREAKVGGTTFHLPEGQVVYEGSGALDFTASWSDPAITSLGAWYASADSTELRGPVVLQNGETARLELTPAMTDIPHSQTTRWSFYFAPAENGGVAMGVFNLKLEVVKMRDISLFPGHPEFFADSPMLTIHDGAHEFQQVSYARRTPNLLLTGAFGENDVTPQNIIPDETRWIHVIVDIEKATSTPGQVDDIKFFYKGADRAFIDYPYLEPVAGSLEEKHLEYAFAVNAEEGDSPYAETSQWRFFVEPITSLTGMDPACGGCTDTEIAYRMQVHAFDTMQEGPESKRVQRGEG